MTPVQQNPPPLPTEVYDYMMKEVTPLKKEVFPFWQEVLTLRITIWEALRRAKLNKHQKTYDDFAARWVRAREKVTVLEKLISPDDREAQKKIGIMLVAGYLQQMQNHEAELTRIMNDLSSTLRDKKTEADFKAAISLSALAVVIGIISIVISFVV